MIALSLDCKFMGQVIDYEQKLEKCSFPLQNCNALVAKDVIFHCLRCFVENLAWLYSRTLG